MTENTDKSTKIRGKISSYLDDLKSGKIKKIYKKLQASDSESFPSPASQLLTDDKKEQIIEFCVQNKVKNKSKLEKYLEEIDTDKEDNKRKRDHSDDDETVEASVKSMKYSDEILKLFVTKTSEQQNREMEYKLEELKYKREKDELDRKERLEREEREYRRELEREEREHKRQVEREIREDRRDERIEQVLGGLKLSMHGGPVKVLIL